MKGTEKVVLIQEQLAKNRLIIDEAAGDIKATIQSSTHERKTVTTVVTKKEMLYIKISAFTEDINAAVVLRLASRVVYKLVLSHPQVVLRFCNMITF